MFSASLSLLLVRAHGEQEHQTLSSDLAKRNADFALAHRNFHPASSCYAWKDTKPSDSISFTSSDNDWSRDLDNVKPFAPSANAANMDSEIGRLDYKTFRFKVIRKLISVGPNLWNTMCYFAEKATPPISLELHDGYGPRTSSAFLSIYGRW